MGLCLLRRTASSRCDEHTTESLKTECRVQKDFETLHFCAFAPPGSRLAVQLATLTAESRLKRAGAGSSEQGVKTYLQRRTIKPQRVASQSCFLVRLGEIIAFK